MATGRVAALQRWPVKGMGGEAVDALAVDDLGVVGDRAHVVYDVFRDAPRRVNAKLAPRLLAWSAAYPDGAGTLAAVTGPDGTSRAWDDPELTAALSADVGRALTLAREPRGAHIDRPRTIHITVDASLAALADALGRPVDVRRFRSNIHLELDAEPFAEEGWVGRRLRVGAAELEVVERCERCPIPGLDPQTQAKWPALLRLLADEHASDFGLIARVLGPAVVRAGDSAQLLS